MAKLLSSSFQRNIFHRFFILEYCSILFQKPFWNNKYTESINSLLKESSLCSFKPSWDQKIAEKSRLKFSQSELIAKLSSKSSKRIVIFSESFSIFHKSLFKLFNQFFKLLLSEFSYIFIYFESTSLLSV